MTINQYNKAPRCRGRLCAPVENAQAHVQIKTQPCGKHTEGIVGRKDCLKVDSSMSASFNVFVIGQSVTG